MHWLSEGLIDYKVVKGSFKELAIVDFLELAKWLMTMQIENS
jgi:hypothetical protein